MSVSPGSPSGILSTPKARKMTASEDTKKIGDSLIEKELDVITNPKVKSIAKDYLDNIHEGKTRFQILNAKALNIKFFMNRDCFICRVIT